MPIDPSLITNAMANWQQPAGFDPISQIAKIQALKNGLVQQQVQQQALQTGALELQEKQKAIQEQDALNAVFKSAYATDPNTGAVTLDETKLYPGMAAAGLGAKIPTIQTAITASKKNAVDFQKADTEAKTAKANYLGQEVLDIADAGYDPGTFTAKINLAVQHGALTQADAAQALQQFQQNPTTDGVKAIVGPMLSHSPVVQDLLDKRKTAQAAVDSAAARKQTAETAVEKERVARVDKAMQALGGATDQASLDQAYSKVITAGAKPEEVAQLPRMFSPQAMATYNAGLLTAEQRAADKRAADTLANTKDFQGKELGLRQQQIGISAGELALRNQEYQKKYGDALADLSDNDKSVAQKIANGDYSMSILGRLPNKEQIMAAAIQINPAVAQSTYDTKQSFTNPEKTQAKNLGTISRIVGHIGRFEENSKKAGLAPLYAAGTNVTGDAKVLSEDAHAISAELEKLTSGGVGSMEQTREWQTALRSTFPDVRQRAIDEISQIIGSQYEGMNQTYKAAIGSELPVAKYVSPAGQKWLQSKGINVSGAAAPGGAPAAAPALPSRLSASDVGKTYLNKAGKPIRITAVNPTDPTQFKFEAAQ